MEPVTHVLTGACLARSGLNRRAAYATLAMAIAAEFPDIDTVWGFRGPISGFEHHRGITHTLLGVPFEAALLLSAFYIVHRLRMRRSPRAGVPNRPAGTFAATRAPVRWPVLYALLLLALLSHLLLDFTNNYGLRPFYPFNPRWYAGSIVFIFDPLLFLLLVAGLTLPALFGLIAREVGTRQEPFRGRGWARAALVGMVLLWAVRSWQHSRAVVLAQAQTLRAPATGAASASATLETAGTGEQPAAPALDRPLLLAGHSLASPDPLSVFRWYTATDFGPTYRLGVADTYTQSLLPGAILVKPAPGDALQAAMRSRLGQIYLDWSPMPLLSVSAETPESSKSSSDTIVTFTDLRFSGDLPWLRSGGRSPLTGQVVLGPANRVVAEGMDGSFGR